MEELGMGYWVTVWVVMALAFIFATVFIIKGFESLDKATGFDDDSANH